MQTLSQMLKFQRTLTLLSTLLLLTVAAPISLASDEKTNELKEQQQKLQQILNEIGDVREQRAEQRVMLENLNKKMQCNWDLIQNYDACDNKYKEQKQEQINCARQAKEKVTECLSEIGE